MVSIQKKISYMIVSGILVMSFFLICTNMLLTSRYSSHDSVVMMNETCAAQAYKVDNQFQIIEQAVWGIVLMSENQRPDVESLRNPETLQKYIDDCRSYAVKIAEGTDCAIAVYYRFNPDLVNSGAVGYFWTKNEETGKLEETEVTDLLMYEPDDVEHVGWYYIPVEAGGAIWMEPYFNKNINREMISFVMPIYDGSQLIGVMGMDIDFDVILDVVSDVDIYETCEGSLLCMSNNRIYDKESSLLDDTIPEDLYKLVTEKENSDELISYKSRTGQKYKLSFRTLRNNMKLLLYVPDNEIYRNRNSAILLGSMITLLIAWVILMFVIRSTKKITGPITEITEATKSYAKGNWEVDIECNTRDELEELTKSILVMADTTKKYINDIKANSYKDALTGLKNRTCYLDYVEKLKKRVKTENTPYALAVFDVNGLKYINDNYGHEEGDSLIKAAGSIICNYFSHSPVFRIGGDEFVAIIDGGDFESCRHILVDMRREMEEKVLRNDYKEVVIACGMAVFPEEAADYDGLFVIADDKMYVNKSKLKDAMAKV